MPPKRPSLLYVVTLAEVGGAQSYVRDLLSATRSEFDVAVAAYGDGPLKIAAEALNVQFVPLRHVRRPLSPLHDLLGLIELFRLFRRLRPDIVHLNSSKAGVLGRIAAWLARVPVCVFTAHGWAFKATTGGAARLYLWADRAVRPMTTMVVCVSELELRAGLRARVCVAERATVIRNGVEVGAYAKRALREGAAQIVSVGRLAEPKDFATLVAALALLPPGKAQLRVLGDGPLRGPLVAQIGELALADSVELVGEVADVRPSLREADLFVLSSRSEAMPLSVLEAMAAGLPVVASDVGGLGEVVVEGETGFLVAPGDPGELAARLAQLVDDRDLRERLGAAGHCRANASFSLARCCGEHLALYRSLLAVGQVRAPRARREGRGATN